MIHRLQEFCNTNKWETYNLANKPGDKIFQIHQNRGFQDETWAYHPRVDEIGPGDFEPCGKQVTVIREVILSKAKGIVTKIQYLQCGHYRTVEVQSKVKTPDQRTPEFEFLLPHQKEAIEFLEENGETGTLEHQMGLGKTITVQVYANEHPENMPCLFVAQAGDLYRVRDEWLEWGGINRKLQAGDMTAILSIPMVYYKGMIPLSQRIVIISWTRLNSPEFKKALEFWQPKMIFVDEIHMYKDPKAQRTKALYSVIKNIQPKSVIGMTGTPVMNKVIEYFPMLNMLKPSIFSTPGVLEQRCIIVNRKPTALHPRYFDWWQENTKDILHRATKESTHIPLPKFQRNYQWVDALSFKGNKMFIDEYNKQLDELDLMLHNHGGVTAKCYIGIFSQLRHWLGLMKLQPSMELIVDWLKLTADSKEKLCIGIHHKFVRQALVGALQDFGCLEMSSENAETKDEIEREFQNNPDKRILIASMIGAGQGRNFQFCKNAIVLERQWNPARERQFEERFHRIMRDPVTRKVRTHFTDEDTVNIDYLLVKDTLDEYFDVMNMLKGQIVDSVCDDDPDEPDVDYIEKLASMVVEKRLKYVG